LLDGATSLGSGTLSAGKATLSTAALGGGSHSITASYGGDTNFAASTSASVTQTVTTTMTATAVTSSLNPSTVGASATFTATVSSTTAGTITGTVTFLDGSTTLGTGSVGASGIATFATSTLTQGSHPITAAYGGDANFAGSTSPSITQTVNAVPDFSVAAVPSTVTLKAGQSGMLTLNVTPIAGATFTVNFSCGALPSKAACTFQPASLTLDGKNLASSTVTIATTANSGGLPFPDVPRIPGWPLIWVAAAVAALLATVSLTSSRLRRRMLSSSAVLLLAVGLHACSGGSEKTGTPPGTYPVTVTVASTAGGVSHTATASLTVTQ